MIKALKVDQNTQCHTIMIGLKNKTLGFCMLIDAHPNQARSNRGGGCHSKEFFFNLHIKSELSRSGHPLRF